MAHASTKGTKVEMAAAIQRLLAVLHNSGSAFGNSIAHVYVVKRIDGVHRQVLHNKVR